MSSAAANANEVSYLTRAYALASTDETRALYDEWASTYESDLVRESQDYVAPAIASQYIVKSLGSDSITDRIEILDAGCGTGLVGIQLAKVGAKKIDGIDLSPGMLEIARAANVYRSLDTADLSRPLTRKDRSYDVVVCIGTLTQGHVGPMAFLEFVRVTKASGLIVVTVLDCIWETGGYRAAVDALVHEGRVRVVSDVLEEYRRGAGVQAKMIVLRVM